MSSHREAPGISQDPVADNADVYAFVSPDDPTMVTILSNFVPLQGPAGGPNFFEFGDDVLYSIFIDNNGDALPDITYQFRFNTTLRNEDTFLYNTGTIDSLDSDKWNKRQFYDVTVIRSHSHGKKQHHEQARKKHSHDQQEHARELARQKPNTAFMWVLGIGITLLVALVIAASVM